MILSRWFKLDKGAEKSREGVFARLASVFEQPRPIDDHLWTELEELLLEADVGVKTTDQLLEILNNEVELGNATTSKDLYRVLQDELVLSLEEVAPLRAGIILSLLFCVPILRGPAPVATDRRLGPSRGPPLHSPIL